MLITYSRKINEVTKMFPHTIKAYPCFCSAAEGTSLYAATPPRC